MPNYKDNKYTNEIDFIKNIRKLSSANLLGEFEKCVRQGAGINSAPFLWYKKEILFRLEHFI